MIVKIKEMLSWVIWRKVSQKYKQKHQWCNRRGGRRAKCSRHFSPENFCWPCRKREARKKKREIRNEKKESCKREGQNLALFLFFLLSTFGRNWKPQNFGFGIPKCKFQRGNSLENKFNTGKNWERWFCPSCPERYFLCAPLETFFEETFWYSGQTGNWTSLLYCKILNVANICTVEDSNVPTWPEVRPSWSTNFRTLIYFQPVLESLSLGLPTFSGFFLRVGLHPWQYLSIIWPFVSIFIL